MPYRETLRPLIREGADTVGWEACGAHSLSAPHKACRKSQSSQWKRFARRS